MLNSQTKSAKGKQQAEHVKQTHEAEIAASKRHSAIIGWEDKFIQSATEPYSLRIQQIIMPTDGSPIVLYGYLEDISRRDDKYFIQVNDWRVGGFSIHFTLECDASTAARLLDRRESFGEISVIAQITSVEKAQLTIRSGIKTTEDPAPVELDSSDLFIAHGRCVELISSNN